MFVFFFILFKILFIIMYTEEKNNIMQTYLETKNADTLKNIPVEVQTEIENIFYNWYIKSDKLNDPVCFLSNEKKKALCAKVFEKIGYIYAHAIHLNEIVLYLGKLECKTKQVTYNYINVQNNDNIITKKVLRCPGRHYIIHTSFIEDHFYDFVYLSSGPEINSLTIYTYKISDPFNLLQIYDIIYNIDLVSDLNYELTVTLRDVLVELKFNKASITTTEAQYLKKMYIKEQNFYKNDPVCDLDYERKISLCQIIYSKHFYRNELEISLNLSASYMFNMNCVTRPVYSKVDDIDEILLNKEQKLYPCFAKPTNSTVQNILGSMYVNTFYISRGPRRNSVIIYVHSVLDRYNEKFSIFQIVENINLKTILPTIIDVSDLIEESFSTYVCIEQIMNDSLNRYKTELTLVEAAVELRGKNEFEMINQLVDVSEKEFYKLKENISREESKEKQIDELLLGKSMTIPLYHKEEEERTDSTINNTMQMLLGPQTFKRLLDRKRNENPFRGIMKESTLTKNVTKNIKKKLFDSDKMKQTDKKLKEDVQKLIRNMKLFIVQKNVQKALLKRKSELVVSETVNIPKSQ